MYETCHVYYVPYVAILHVFLCALCVVVLYMPMRNVCLYAMHFVRAMYLAN